MLKAAFNALTSLHSRPAQLKRLGTPDIYSLIRITPANYFRFLKGPEYTTVKGVEFIIPKDSAVGHLAQKFTLNKVPDDGSFKINFGILSTTDLAFDATDEDIQTAVRLLSGFSNTVVTGDFSSGFIFTFLGHSAPPTMGDISDSTLESEGDTSLIDTWSRQNTLWDKQLLKGDRIIDGSNLWSVDEIVDLHDIGASVMGWRVRCD